MTVRIVHGRAKGPAAEQKVSCLPAAKLLPGDTAGFISKFFGFSCTFLKKGTVSELSTSIISKKTLIHLTSSRRS